MKDIDIKSLIIGILLSPPTVLLVGYFLIGDTSRYDFETAGQAAVLKIDRKTGRVFVWSPQDGEDKFVEIGTGKLASKKSPQTPPE